MSCHHCKQEEQDAINKERVRDLASVSDVAINEKIYAKHKFSGDYVHDLGLAWTLLRKIKLPDLQFVAWEYGVRAKSMFYVESSLFCEQPHVVSKIICIAYLIFGD